METSLKKHLLTRFKEIYDIDPDLWIHSGDIERFVARETTCKPSYGARQLRFMAEEGVIERKVEPDVKGVWYRYKAKPKLVAIPTGDNSVRLEYKY